MAKRKRTRKTSKKDYKEVAAHWAFLVSIALAIILGIILPSSTIAAGLLVILGIIVGLINITADETRDFLIASIALIIAAEAFALIPFIGNFVANILNYVVIFVAPAAGIVALLTIWKLARTK